MWFEFTMLYYFVLLQINHTFARKYMLFDFKTGHSFEIKVCNIV